MNTALVNGTIPTHSAGNHRTLGLAAFAAAAIVSFTAILSLGGDGVTDKSVPMAVRVTSLAAYGPQSVAPADAGSVTDHVPGEFFWCTPGLLTQEALDLLTSFNICQPR